MRSMDLGEECPLCAVCCVRLLREVLSSQNVGILAPSRSRHVHVSHFAPLRKPHAASSKQQAASSNNFDSSTSSSRLTALPAAPILSLYPMTLLDWRTAIFAAVETYHEGEGRLNSTVVRLGWGGRTIRLATLFLLVNLSFLCAFLIDFMYSLGGTTTCQRHVRYCPYPTRPDWLSLPVASAKQGSNWWPAAVPPNRSRMPACPSSRWKI